MKRTMARRTLESEESTSSEIQGAENERAPRRLSSLLDENVIEEVRAQINAAKPKESEKPAATQSESLLSLIWRLRFAGALVFIAPISIVWSTKISPEFENVFSTVLALLLLYDLVRDVFQQSKVFQSAIKCHISSLVLVLLGVVGWAVFALTTSHKHTAQHGFFWWIGASSHPALSPRLARLYDELHSLNFAIVIISATLVLLRVFTIDLMQSNAATAASVSPQPGQDKEKKN